ncbi:phosphatidylserine decarboxylase [Nocardiopsis gilva YIM 90087]|uniref:Phosphatidylserine decarboxylase n=2 Tax=Nocardiopsis gilva TaxID=280236 RepID=A0A223S847_9ACTN|nr:phosphatidylserine decarboxylase [Nocardiopsis gilva]ASU84283.1 phosphatidylserine decarboxylase [Nocardiopsis gilva YIM 90087]
MTHNEFEPSATIDDFIEKIRRWYEEDYQGFRTMYDAAVENVKPLPDDTPDEVSYDWRNNTIEDLCNFFRSWYEWKPGVHDGLNYIEMFSWLSYENDYGMVFFTSGPGYQMTAEFTELQGQYMDSPDSLPLVKAWEDQLGQSMDDYVIPPEGFKNFNEFFARAVKPGKRPIDAPDDKSVVVAPADCVINMIVDELTETTPIPVKTVTMNVKELLGDSPYADKFIGGTAVSCILMPDMYHCYHAPVEGKVVESRDDVGGIYYGMRDFPDLLNKGDVGYGYDYSMFDNFRRGYLVIDTEDLDRGHVGMVPVGLNSIASVQFLEKFKSVSRPQRVPVDKGEKIGFFKYGGSLNILLFEKGRFPALRLHQGQRIGHFESKETSLGLFSGSWRTPSRRRRF